MSRQLLGAPINVEERAKMSFTLSYKSGTMTRPYKSLFISENHFFFFLREKRLLLPRIHFRTTSSSPAASSSSSLLWPLLLPSSRLVNLLPPVVLVLPCRQILCIVLCFGLHWCCLFCVSCIILCIVLPPCHACLLRMSFFYNFFSVSENP